MRLGMVGLGRMGLNMTRRLLQHDHQVVGYNKSPGPIETAVSEGAEGAQSLKDLVSKLDPPRIVWVMVPSGSPTAYVISDLHELLEEGDIVIDGGNSKWKDTLEHSEQLAAKGIRLLDCGTSGGIWGLEVGYCLMIGGERTAFEQAEPIFRDLTPEDGYGYMGSSGAGHFVKMVHNGIEYALLQAYGEGFEILQQSEYDLDLLEVARVWNHGSVIRSWLLELTEKAFEEDPKLEAVAGYVEDSGEGRWTVQAAIHEAVPAPAIASALFARFYSRLDESFAAKLIAALRNQFGGHEVKRATDEGEPG